jgi:S1-C subfamily serine protease
MLRFARMRIPPLRPVPLRLKALLALALCAGAAAASAQAPSLDELVSAVVRVKTQIEPDGRTVNTLGRERDGSGVVIDGEGLVLTIGYLMVEARAAEIGTHDGRTVPASIVGYDHESGFGLLRALVPLKLALMGLGRSAEVKERDPVLVASHGGAGMVAPARVVAKREFAGSWEYLLDEAIFTAPPHPAWSGAALISREGKLVGVGSLIVGDAGEKAPGNMFVPIDRLAPILADLIGQGRGAGPGRPWLGLTTNEVKGELVIERVVPGGPAERAGVQAGATIVAINGEKPTSLADFYRKVWAQGGPGVVVRLEVLEGPARRPIEITSMNRLDHLRLKSSL